MSDPIAKVTDIIFVRFQIRDLHKQATYLSDFGMAPVHIDDEAIYFRGTGEDAYIYAAHKGEEDGFLAAAYEVSSMAELEALAADQNVAIEDGDALMGGKLARLTDPDGLKLEVYHGVKKTTPVDLQSPVLNYGKQKQRLNETQRFGAGADEWEVEADGNLLYKLASHVMRLGHVALNVKDGPASIAWYQRTLGMLVSDNIIGPDGAVGGAFIRCDNGDMPSDHHTLNVVGLPPEAEPFHGTFGHAGFELEKSLDDLMAGHFHMKTVGAYVHEWGIGRHLLGSQLYDYWRDPAGFILEHWTDGDLLTADIPAQNVSIVDVVKGQYGPEPFSTFNMSLPIEAVEEFRDALPSMGDVLLKGQKP
jgi:catechol 2,3-dioxygenase-like lactoylglutathione lyase family enzyme